MSPWILEAEALCEAHWIGPESRLFLVSPHQIRRKFGTSKCAKTPLTARRPKTKVPQVEALMTFFSSAHCKSLRSNVVF